MTKNGTARHAASRPSCCPHLRKKMQQAKMPSREAPARQDSLNRLLKNAIVAFFNLARCRAKLRTARKITTCVAILSSHPCDGAAC